MRTVRTITNAVLLEKINGLEKLIDERFADNTKEHQGLIAQTTKTNGSVTTLQRWMAMTKGALAILSAFVVPVLLYLVYIHIGK